MTETQLSILNTSDVPIYRQLYEQLASGIILGRLPCGFCLPTIRSLAAQLGISVISIKRAWDELERDGFIVTMVGRGCFVAELSEAERNEKRLKLALEQFKKSAPIYRALGMTAAELIELIKLNYDD